MQHSFDNQRCQSTLDLAYNPIRNRITMILVMFIQATTYQIIGAAVGWGCPDALKVWEHFGTCQTLTGIFHLRREISFELEEKVQKKEDSVFPENEPKTQVIRGGAH
jgi:hypothetical protein